MPVLRVVKIMMHLAGVSAPLLSTISVYCFICEQYIQNEILSMCIQLQYNEFLSLHYCKRKKTLFRFGLTLIVWDLEVVLWDCEDYTNV